MGVTAAWIGFEGMQAGYEKQKGKSYEQIFNEMRSVGIAPAASMIIGFDYQTPEVIEREYAELLRLRPAISQFLIYGPTRNTPLYHRLKDEGRLTDVCGRLYPMQDGFTLGFDHPNISAPTMKLIARQLYRGEYHHLGATIYRTLEVTLEGYRNLKNAREPRLRIRAEMQRDFLRNAQAAKRIGLIFAPNNLVRTRVEAVFEEIEAELGPAPPLQEIQSYLVIGLGLWTKLKFKYDIFTQIPPRRHEYNLPARNGFAAVVPERVRSKLSGLLG
jgi:hypothetical protein